MNFAVLLASDDDLRLAPLGAAFAVYRSVPVIDGTQEAKRCWGIAGENMTETEADRLIGCLAKTGVKAVKFPQTDFHAISPPTLLNHASFSDAGLTGVDNRGHEKSAAWGEMRVIGIAQIKSSSFKTVTERQGPTPGQKAVSIGIMMATGLPIPIGPKKQTVTKTVSQNEYSLVLDVVTAREECVRMFEDRINYASLKERKLYNVTGNFKLVVGDLVRRAPQAKLGKGARLLTNNQPLSGMGYEGLADLERECRWIYFRG